jgi:signal transduction histidine kinase/DNA-binding NarL/FixJ family response regulator
MMDPSNIRGASILVVDDEEANIDLLEGLLRDEGYTHITSSGDARHALPLFREVQPDLVLLDLHMPHIDGFEVLRQLAAATPRGSYVPVLVLTADVTPEARQRALSSGARDFLTKPIDATETLLRIRNLLETRMLHLEQARVRDAALTAGRRAEFLAEASRLLSASFDYETTIATLARHCVGFMADYCVVDLLNGDGRLARVGCAHVDPTKEALLGRVTRFSSDVPHEHPVMEALNTGRSVLVREVRPEMIDTVVLEEEHRAIIHALAPRSMLTVPLTASGRTIGVLVLSTSQSGRTYGPDDLELAEELGRRAALAVENARLFHEARRATRARDEMLAIVAHDLRNPLNTISMSTQVLDELTDAGAAPVQARQVEVILRSVRRMNELIQDLLDIKRIESGRLLVEPRPEDPGALIREALEILRPLAEARAQRLEHELGRLPPVLADPPRIQQLISNLVGNAIKFTPAGGSIVVRAAADTDEIRVCVEDTGPGIPAEQLPHVFGHFWQADRADRRGIGLGLAIAKGIAEAHGGRIWVSSREGGGSAFFFTLPTAGGTSGRPPTAVPRRAPGA